MWLCAMGVFMVVRWLCGGRGGGGGRRAALSTRLDRLKAALVKVGAAECGGFTGRPVHDPVKGQPSCRLCSWSWGGRGGGVKRSCIVREADCAGFTLFFTVAGSLIVWVPERAPGRLHVGVLQVALFTSM